MSITKIPIDYVWIDNQVLRYKTRILYADLRRYSDLPSYMGSVPRMLTSSSDLERIPTWVDTENNSVLKPVKLYQYSDKKYLVLCETYDDKNVPTPFNYRYKLYDVCKKFEKINISVKQEYIFNNPVIPKDNSYYCGINSYGGYISDKFVQTCIDMDINIDEISSLEYYGKWSYKLTKNHILWIADDLCITRFMLHKICNDNKEKLILDISKTTHPEIPLKLHVISDDKELIFNSHDNPYQVLCDLVLGVK